jgi:hypothetical protein
MRCRSRQPWSQTEEPSDLPAVGAGGKFGLDRECCTLTDRDTSGANFRKAPFGMDAGGALSRMGSESRWVPCRTIMASI